jgi:hypothetical protein
MINMPKERLERYMEWLERMEIPIEEYETVERFQDYLLDEFGITGKRAEALTEAMTFCTEELLPEGVRPFTIEFPWGEQIRYAVKGHPGAWGWRRMLELVGLI